MAHANETAALRQRPTLDAISSKIVDLIEFESITADAAESIAEVVCGSVPGDGASSPDYPVSGSLDRIAQLLETLASHQRRVRYASERLGGALLPSPESGGAVAANTKEVRW